MIIWLKRYELSSIASAEEVDKWLFGTSELTACT